MLCVVIFALLVAYTEQQALSAFVFFKHEVEVRRHFNNGADAFNRGDWADAMEGFIAAAMEPHGARYRGSAWYNVGLIRVFTEDMGGADTAFINSLIAHNSSAVHNMIGILRARSGNLDAAMTHFEAAVELDAENVVAARNYIVALSKAGRDEEAKERFEQLSELESTYTEEFLSRIDVMQQAGEPGPVGLTDRVLECDIRASSADGWTDIELPSCELVDAERELMRGICDEPTDPNGWYKLGNYYRDIDMVWRVVRVMSNAIRLDPKFAPAMAIMGAALNDAKYFVESIAPLERGLSLHAGDLWAQANLVMSLAWSCEWSKLDGRMEEFARQLKIAVNGDVKSFPAPAHMLLIIHHHLDMQVYRDWVDKWSREKADRVDSGPFFSKYPKELLPPRISDNQFETDENGRRGRLRLGYVSGAGFQKSPGSSAIRGIFHAHNRDTFDIHCIALKPERFAGELRKNISGECDSWHEFVTIRSDQELAELVNAVQIHTLIDVTGYSGDHRLKFLAHRPCPTSLTWLEYPGTLGKGVAIDGIITDSIASAPEFHVLYAEKLLLLPAPYLPNDYAATVFTPHYALNPLPKDKPPVFCALHHVWKMDAAIFSVWMALLRRVEGAVLRLQECALEAKEVLRWMAAEHGVEANRLVFNAKMADYYEHINRLSECSLFLDAANYNAHTSSADSLWAGTPVITVPHELMISRGASCLLGAVGLEMCIARNVAEYRDLVLAAGSSWKNLEHMRSRLRATRHTHNLFDTPRWVCAFERGAKMLWETYLSKKGDVWDTTNFHMIPNDVGCARMGQSAGAIGGGVNG